MSHIAARGLAMAVLAGALGLGACTWPPASEPAPPPAEKQAMMTGRHCYSTLAEVDCFTRPLPGEDHRRVGWFDAPGPI